MYCVGWCLTYRRASARDTSVADGRRYRCDRDCDRIVGCGTSSSRFATTSRRRCVLRRQKRERRSRNELGNSLSSPLCFCFFFPFVVSVSFASRGTASWLQVTRREARQRERVSASIVFVPTTSKVSNLEVSTVEDARSPTFSVGKKRKEKQVRTRRGGGEGRLSNSKRATAPHVILRNEDVSSRRGAARRTDD